MYIELCPISEAANKRIAYLCPLKSNSYQNCAYDRIENLRKEHPPALCQTLGEPSNFAALSIKSSAYVSPPLKPWSALLHSDGWLTFLSALFSNANYKSAPLLRWKDSFCSFNVWWWAVVRFFLSVSNSSFYTLRYAPLSEVNHLSITGQWSNAEPSTKVTAAVYGNPADSFRNQAL